MREIREVLRLRHERGLTHRPIAASVGIAPSSVSEYLRRAKAAGVTWKSAEELGDAELEARLFQHVGRNEPQARAPVDFKWVHEEMRRKGVTLQLLWLEYQEGLVKNPTGQRAYQYSQFCDLYNEHRSKLSVVMRQVHRAGEKAFIDYSGQRPHIIDKATGEESAVELYVMVLGASNYTYVEATRTQSLPDFVGATVRGLEYFGGVTELLVPDNLKSAVKTAHRYEPEINATYAEMGQHYGTAIVPARPRKPRDKAKVEAGVLLAQRWIVACLRNRRFFSLEELNAAIRELLEKLNTRPFRKLSGCRRSVFESIDRPAMKPLPARRYEMGEWKMQVGVNVDYHFEYDHRIYSVPSVLVNARVDLRTTANMVEVWRSGVQVALHERSYGPKGTAVTNPEHRPPSHRELGAWPKERLVGWAAKTGPRMAEVVEAILSRSAHPEAGRRACLGLIRLADRYGAERLEAACARAIRIGNPTMKSVEWILKTGLDKMAESREVEPARIEHENIRGGAYFEREEDVLAPPAAGESRGEQDVPCGEGGERPEALSKEVEASREETRQEVLSQDEDEIEEHYLVEERLGIMNDSLAPVVSSLEVPTRESLNQDEEETPLFGGSVMGGMNDSLNEREVTEPKGLEPEEPRGTHAQAIERTEALAPVAKGLPELIARLRTTWSRPTRVDRGGHSAPRKAEPSRAGTPCAPPCTSPTGCAPPRGFNDARCDEKETNRTSDERPMRNIHAAMDCPIDEEGHAHSSPHPREKE